MQDEVAGRDALPTADAILTAPKKTGSQEIDGLDKVGTDLFRPLSCDGLYNGRVFSFTL